MRLPLLSLIGCLTLLAACTVNPGDSVEGRPVIADERGQSVTVLSVHPESDRTTVELLAVNGSDRPMTLGRQHSPISLQDETGTTLDGPNQSIEVPAHSSNRLRVEFAGRPEGSTMTLSAGDLSLTNLPTARTTFSAAASPTVGDLSRAQVNHANGTSVRVTRVEFNETETSVDVEIVNGHDNEVRLSNRQSDRAHLQDETGRIYPLIPVANNSDLRISEGQTLQGTLRFAGPIQGPVQQLTLRFNSRFGSDREFANNPQIVIDIPTSSP